ncbi:MAG: tetratricopeptide repeat protein [Helicobacter sp.]|nr:tetratricopeptide repeat protein [Helicobacter sp.]MDE6044342.1 tetratricopeptide repeat protein [Helicobacter sp.]MDE7196941.1 tetratricopeptide repeat protein [Helicobacter sp.]
MSLEQNIQKLKDEAVAEEKFLESFLRIEKFWKNFKTPIIIALVVFVFGSAGYFVSQWFAEMQKREHFALYESLLSEPENEQKLLALKQSGSPLYELFLLKRASVADDVSALEQLSGSQEGFLAMLARYQAASLKGDLSALDSLHDVDMMLAEMTLLQRAYLLLKKGDIAEAHSLLGKIPLDSPLRGIAQFFVHYGITKTTQKAATQDASSIPEGIEILDTNESQDNGVIEGIELFNGAKSQPKE